MSSSFFLPLPALSAPKSPLEKGRASVLSWRGKTCLPCLRAGCNPKADKPARIRSLPRLRAGRKTHRNNIAHRNRQTEDLPFRRSP